MSAWIIGLGVAAGYLVNKNLSIKSAVEQSAARYEGGAEGTTGGATSAEVRNAWKRTDHVKYGDFNTDLPKKQMDQLDAAAQRAASEVEQFDGSMHRPIQGVMMQYDRLGV